MWPFKKKKEVFGVVEKKEEVEKGEKKGEEGSELFTLASASTSLAEERKLDMGEIERKFERIFRKLNDLTERIELLERKIERREW